jgi:hypothetical protein
VGESLLRERPGQVGGVFAMNTPPSLSTNVPIATGKDAITKAIASDLASGDLKWHANKVGVVRSGEFGYTSGTYSMNRGSKTHRGELSDKGKYLTVCARRMLSAVSIRHSPNIFSGQDVLGKHLRFLGDRQSDREIVGIVGNIRRIALSDPQRPEMYVAYAQYAPPTMNLAVRAAANPGPLQTALYDAVRAIDEDETLSAFRSLDDILESSVAQPRFSSCCWACSPHPRSRLQLSDYTD